MDTTRTEKISQILEAANGHGDEVEGEGIITTKITPKVFVNSEQLKKYLTLLVEDDFLSYDPKMHTYKTTKKGRIFLKAYNEIDKMLKEKQI